VRAFHSLSYVDHANCNGSLGFGEVNAVKSCINSEPKSPSLLCQQRRFFSETFSRGATKIAGRAALRQEMRNRAYFAFTILILPE